MTVKLSTPRVRVVLASSDKELELQTTNADLVLWDRTRIKHKWPKFEDAPFLWLTFISWSAARREGAVAPDLKYEAWEIDVLEASAIDPDADDGEVHGEPFPERESGAADR